MKYSIDKLEEGILPGDGTYHGWPSVANTGLELLAVCSGNRKGHICPNGREYLYRSSDDGRTWNGPEKLSSGPLDDRDCGITVASDGSILINYFTNLLGLLRDHANGGSLGRKISVSDLAEEHNFWMRRSTDGGRNWSEKYPIPLNNPHGAAVARDGKLIFAGRCASVSPAYLFEGSRLGEKLVFARSGDHGLTWKIVSEIPVPEGDSPSHCFEANQIETADGEIVVQFRNQNRPPQVETWQTISRDGGNSWERPKYLKAGYPTHLLKLSGSRILMTYGWREKPFGIRCRISENGAANWSKEYILRNNAPSSDMGYPSTTILNDGSLFTLWYEANRSSSVLKYLKWNLLGKE